MVSKPEYISGRKLLERWNIEDLQLCELVFLQRALLPVEVEEDEEDERWSLDFEGCLEEGEIVRTLTFRTQDIEAFEDENEWVQSQEFSLSASEKRKLGRLEREQEKWDATIVAAFQMGLLASGRAKGNPFKRDELFSEIDKLGLGLAAENLNRIWRAIPDIYKKGPGRPQAPPTPKKSK